MDLRDEIARIIERNVCEVGAEGLEGGEILGADTAAEQILAIPEIAEALTLRNVHLAAQMPDLPPERVGELIKGISPSSP